METEDIEKSLPAPEQNADTLKVQLAVDSPPVWGGTEEAPTLCGSGCDAIARDILRRQLAEADSEIAELTEDLEIAQHKYDVINGKFRAEVPRQAKQIRELKEEIVRLKATPVTRDDELDDADKRIIVERGLTEGEYRKVMQTASRKWIRRLLGFKM